MITKPDLSKGEQFSPEFERLNPLHFVPVLVDGNVVVSDSFAILMYLEEKYPQNALLPVDPKRKAVNLQVSSIVSCSIQPLQMLGVLKYIEEKLGPEERQSWAQHHIEKGFIALEKLLKDSSGKYATGDEVCMAEVFLAPQISSAITRFHVDVSKFPILIKIYEACKALPAFQASLPERQPDAIVHGDVRVVYAASNGKSAEFIRVKAPGMPVAPWGLQKSLEYVKLKYKNPAVKIHENGYADSVSSPAHTNDTARIEYLQAYIESLLLSIRNLKRFPRLSAHLYISFLAKSGRKTETSTYLYNA